MGVKHFTVTPGTIGTTLRSLVSSTINIGTCKQIFIQAHSANSGVLKVGGNDPVPTTLNYGVEIPIPLTSIPAAPMPLEGNTGLVSLADVGILAANTTDKAHLLCITP